MDVGIIGLLRWILSIQPLSSGIHTSTLNMIHAGLRTAERRTVQQSTSNMHAKYSRVRHNQHSPYKQHNHAPASEL